MKSSLNKEPSPVKPTLSFPLLAEYIGTGKPNRSFVAAFTSESRGVVVWRACDSTRALFEVSDCLYSCFDTQQFRILDTTETVKLSNA